MVDDDPVGGAAAMESLMGLPVRPTAVVWATDTLAPGALHAALGLRILGGLSITGVDEPFFATSTVPSLTTIRFPITEMAAVAVREAINPEPAGGGTKEHVIQASFVMRGSARPAPMRSEP